jgi:beta-N-acetylhexosaminidase
MTRPGEELLRLAATVLQPGFEGTAPPDWVRRLLGEGLGSVALFSRNVESPAQVAALTAALRAERADVLVGIDEEAGDVTRFESRLGSSRPGNLALGHVDDVALTTAVARDLGCELAAAGVNLDYAPDADVNNNPDNPVIGVRSFGADPALVARHTAAWVTGLQEAGVAACAKHFPGHGDTAVDSHRGLPVIDADEETFRRRDLPPFAAAVEAGAELVMTSHVVFTALDAAPATLSRRLLQGLLRDELGFDGVVITDSTEAAAVQAVTDVREAAVRNVRAGVDIVLTTGRGSYIQVYRALLEEARRDPAFRERVRESAARVVALQRSLR